MFVLSLDVVLEKARVRIQTIFGMDLCYLSKPATVTKNGVNRNNDSSTFLLVNRLTHPDHIRCEGVCVCVCTVFAWVCWATQPCTMCCLPL